MGFLGRLFGGSKRDAGPTGWNAGAGASAWPPPGPITSWPTGNVNMQGSAWIFDRHPRQYVDVVGESHYQPALEQIAGGRTADGPRYPNHTAVLLPEPTNEHDPNAVRVIVAREGGGEGVLAGYLSREDAVAYRPVIDRVAESGRVTMCYASLKGGYDRMVSFGVTLRIGQPWSLMAELDRDMGADPRWPPEVVAAGPDERPYNRTDCPYCGEELHPLPKRKRACPSCGQPVSVQSGPDGIRYLLREADLAAHQSRWDAFFGGQSAAAGVTVSIQATRTLASYAAHGVRFVDMTPGLPDACPACLEVAGRRFALPDAPSIPIPACSNEVCRCDYLPVAEVRSTPQSVDQRDAP